MELVGMRMSTRSRSPSSRGLEARGDPDSEGGAKDEFEEGDGNIAGYTAHGSVDSMARMQRDIHTGTTPVSRA